MRREYIFIIKYLGRNALPYVHISVACLVQYAEVGAARWGNLEPGQVLQTKSTSPVRAINFTDRLHHQPSHPCSPFRPTSFHSIDERDRGSCVPRSRLHTATGRCVGWSKEEDGDRSIPLVPCRFLHVSLHRRRRLHSRPELAAVRV